MTIHHSIWTTAECSAWSRDFDYSGYLDLHHKMECKGGILSEEAYKLLCQAFEYDCEKACTDVKHQL